MQYFIGLMSGTSADGVDAALVRIGDRLNQLELVRLHSKAFSAEERQKLLLLMRPETARVDEICRWHFRLAKLYANAVQELLTATGVAAEQIVGIGMHGQTIHHLPGEGTLQLGNAAMLANAVGIPVVHDFRSADMAWGGQGAPLVPFFDQLVFGSTGQATAVQNLGGIGNVTVVGPGSDALPAVAFDTGPANMIMDALMLHFSAGKDTYDRDGRCASAGQVDEELVQKLLQHEYFQLLPPKSTGRELFGSQYVEELLAAHSFSQEDWLATATAFTAASLAQQYQKFIEPYLSLERIVVGGGGAKNPHLLAEIERYTGLPVTSSEEFGVPVDAKEAMAFAVLAAANLRGIKAGVPGATGAAQAAVLGSVQQPTQ